MNQLFYDFRFGTENAGYYTVTEDGDTFHMDVAFVSGGEVCRTPFSFRHDGARVLAYRIGNGEWTTRGLDSPNHFPTSAYPLLLRIMGDELTYIAVMEGVGSILGETLLMRRGNLVYEIHDGAVVREFELRDGVPVRINWAGGTFVQDLPSGSDAGGTLKVNGPISTLCSSREEAARGSMFEREKVQ